VTRCAGKVVDPDKCSNLPRVVRQVIGVNRVYQNAGLRNVSRAGLATEWGAGDCGSLKAYAWSAADKKILTTGA